MGRTYNQDCVLAHALDLLGERWTLLILRDLFLGPQRFGDLQANLPGIGANLLSKRLKELDEAGLIDAPGPGETRGRYKLSADGEALRPAVHSLVKWSIEYFYKRPETQPAKQCIFSDNLQPDTVALAVELFSNKTCEPSLNYVAHLTIDDFPYTLYYMNGVMTARRGADAPAVAHIAVDVDAIMQAFRGELSAEDLRRKMRATGDEKAIAHLVRCIAHEPMDAASVEDAA